MKHIFSLLLLFVGYATTSAQCNEANYQRIFNDAETARKNGDYLQAKAKYEAADIFSCNNSQKDACNKAVNALFLEIETLRKEADAQKQKADAAKKKSQVLALTSGIPKQNKYFIV